MITFALGFIPVYSNLLEVAAGTGRAGGERPGGTWAWRGVRESSQAGERWRQQREREGERWGEKEAERDRETHTEGRRQREREREGQRERGEAQRPRNSLRGTERRYRERGRETARREMKRSRPRSGEKETERERATKARASVAERETGRRTERQRRRPQWNGASLTPTLAVTVQPLKNALRGRPWMSPAFRKRSASTSHTGFPHMGFPGPGHEPARASSSKMRQAGPPWANHSEPQFP